ncbi:MAG: hypothetical protein NT096_07235 [Proteobacteria bacterium]|nr:hypothetical protein [Pseudomonadota bacterium]
MFEKIKAETMSYIEGILRVILEENDPILISALETLKGKYRFSMCRLLLLSYGETTAFPLSACRALLYVYEGSILAAELRRSFSLDRLVDMGSWSSIGSKDISRLTGSIFNRSQEQLVAIESCSNETRLSLVNIFNDAFGSRGRLGGEALELEQFQKYLRNRQKISVVDIAAGIWLCIYEAFLKSCELVCDNRMTELNTVMPLLGTVARREYLIDISHRKGYDFDYIQLRKDLLEAERELRNALCNRGGALNILE